MASRIPQRVFILLVAGYIALVAIIIAGMLLLRQNVLASQTTPQAQAAWNQRRVEASKQDGTHSPVQRSVPRSDEPPALVLMRDYFAAVLIGLLLPISALYAFITWIVCGVTYPPTKVSAAAPRQ